MDGISIMKILFLIFHFSPVIPLGSLFNGASAVVSVWALMEHKQGTCFVSQRKEIPLLPLLRMTSAMRNWSKYFAEFNKIQKVIKLFRSQYGKNGEQCHLLQVISHLRMAANFQSLFLLRIATRVSNWPKIWRLSIWAENCIWGQICPL